LDDRPEATKNANIPYQTENCANTGVPIVAPNVSNTCGVCGMKCLKYEELLNIAPHLKSIVDEDISKEHCGGCGGKFIN
jgi:hypothetical protein